MTWGAHMMNYFICCYVVKEDFTQRRRNCTDRNDARFLIEANYDAQEFLLSPIVN